MPSVKLHQFTFHVDNTRRSVRKSTVVAMLSTVFLWLPLASVIIAHIEAGNGFPKVVGGSHFAAKLRSRNIFAEAQVLEDRDVIGSTNPSSHIKRQNCGPGVGSCAAGYCCSSGG